jgi:AhpD family alkylhydroperoxidase
MVGLQNAVDSAILEPLLLELVKMRASQINGCAHCLDVHSKDARALGEAERCEHLTLISEAGAPEAVYETLEESFSAEEIVALTLAIVAINGWNRLAISMREPVGAYASPHTPDIEPSSSGSRHVGLTGTHAKQEGETCP